MNEQIGHLYELVNIPLTLIDHQGHILHSWAEMPVSSIWDGMPLFCLDHFHQHGQDEKHPLIMYLDPGFLLGLMQLDAETYLLIGLASPVPQTKNRIIEIIADTVCP